jgi:hypothetical protein
MIRRVSALLVLALALLAVSPAAASSDQFSPVEVKVRVRDRNGLPARQLPVKVRASLQGWARNIIGQTERVAYSTVESGRTNDEGVATIEFHPPRFLAGFNDEAKLPWFRGTAGFRAQLGDPKSHPTVLYHETLKTTVELPNLTDEPAELSAITFEQADLTVDGFPVWLGRDRRLDRVVVIAEGFDLYNNVSASDIMAGTALAGDAARWAGVEVMVVSYPDARRAPDELAPLVARAVRAAANVTGRQVALAGISMGGIVGRWALVEAEALNKPLPVHTFVALDAPNRGARVHPGILALIDAYGAPRDREALNSPAAQALLFAVPKNVRWKQVGLFKLGRKVPVKWEEDSSGNRRFFERLRKLNGTGYPQNTRCIAVGNGTRTTFNPADQLLRLWVPFGAEWTIPADPADRVPGSLLPLSYAQRFAIRKPLGVAGAYMRSTPTFIPTTSALDAAPGEKPPFASYFTRPEYLKPLPHSTVDPLAAGFVVHEILTTPWPSIRS